MRSRSTALWAVAIVSLGCSASGREEVATDASAPASDPAERAATGIERAGTRDRAAQILADVRRFGVFSWSLDEGAVMAKRDVGVRLDRLSRARDATIARRAGAWTTVGGSELSVTLPTLASGVTHVSLASAPDFWIELGDEGLDAVEGAIAENAVVYGEAARDTDVVQIVTPRRLEEVRVLRAAKAAPALRFVVRGSAEVSSLDVVDDRIVATAPDGRQIASEPMFAIDSLGERRALSLRTSRVGDELRVEATLDARGLAYPIAIDPAWTSAASMPVARMDYGAVNTHGWCEGSGASGMFALLGGNNAGGNLADAVVYGASETWGYNGMIPSMAVPRRYGLAVTVPRSPSSTVEGDQATWDTVLVTGGSSTVGSTTTWPAATYLAIGSTSGCGYPATWKAANNAGKGVSKHSATFLGDPVNAQVLVMGGWNGSAALSTGELWKRSSPTIDYAITPAHEPRAWHTATLLVPNKVLVVGGSYQNPPGTVINPTTAEIYDATTNAWTYTGSMSTSRYSMTATRLCPAASGPATAWKTGGLTADPSCSGGAAGPKILFAGGGGCDLTPRSSAEIYDPSTGLFTSAGSMASAHYEAAAELLPNGRVLVVGGQSWCATMSARAEVYDPVANRWEVASSMSVPRWGMSARRPDFGTCTNGSPSPYPRTCNVQLANYVLVAGGYGPNTTYYSTAEKFEQLDLGLSCGGDGDCLSGHCVNGVCCNVASCGSGQACNLIPYGTSGTGTCKKLQGQTCAAASECGIFGAASAQYCTDGVCCNGGCGGQCQACNVSGAVGSCTTVPAGQLPVTGTNAGRAACDASASASCRGTCDGLDATACHWPSPSTICASQSCVDAATGHSIQSNPAYCSGPSAGTCNAQTTTDCAGYKCTGNQCRTTCSVNDGTQCVGGFKCDLTAGSPTYQQCVSAGGKGAPCATTLDCTSGLGCVDGTCCSSSSCPSGELCNVPLDPGTCHLPLGAACSANPGACAGGAARCVDGYCCNTACSGQCEACNVSGVEGTCSPVVGAPHGSRAACSGVGVCAASCDGANRLSCGAAAPSTTPCGQASCTTGVFTAVAFCDGAGSCAAPSSRSCAPYVCADATSCKTVCATSAECASGYACKSGACITTGALGTDCTDDTQCTSAHCFANPTKSVCCAAASCPSGSICADTSAGTSAGQCMSVNGATCTQGSDCVSGYCTDGVCCDTSCTGQCEACDIPGSVGKCGGVSGAPHGARASCFDGGSDVCKALMCDGSKDRTKCSAFANGVAKQCAQGSCTNGTETAPASCDGAGSCGSGKTKSCSPYVCDATKCKTSCAGDGDCANGYRCNASTSQCDPLESKCSDDGLSSIPLDTSRASKSCAPFLCNPSTGDCYSDCAGTSEACAPGNACDGRLCIASAPATTTSSGGCSAGGREASSAGAMLLGLALASLSRRRRRKAA